MDGLRPLVGLPEAIMPHSLIVVGYPAEQPSPQDRDRPTGCATTTGEIFVGRAFGTRHYSPGEHTGGTAWNTRNAAPRVFTGAKRVNVRSIPVRSHAEHGSEEGAAQ